MSLLKLDHKLEKTIRAHSPACDETIIDSERQEEGMDLLANAISQLTKVQQRALFLKFEQDLNYTEIAVLLNISVESARTNMYRALKSLRKSLSKHEISLNLFVLLYSENQL